MNKSLTESEKLFENWCKGSALPFRRVPETVKPTPDYEIQLNQECVYVEIKQIDEDSDFRVDVKNGTSVGSRIQGSHVRKKIAETRNQFRDVSKNGYQTILLIHNNLDGLQLFGTSQGDFTTGMFGELTINIKIDSRESSEVFNGKNKSLRENKNTTFSAVGHLQKTREGANVHIYENPYASNPIDFEKLPSSISWNRIEFDRSPLKYSKKKNAI